MTQANTSSQKKKQIDNLPLVNFVGAGPGAEDLITVRGQRALEEADLVLYAGSLVNPIHLNRCKSTSVHLDTASMNLEEQVTSMAKAAKEGQVVVRLHTGDPAMYGAINEQIKGLSSQGIGVQIIPGVSSVFAAAAALGCELTCPDISQSVVLTRTPGRTPMPKDEKASSFAKTGATLVFFLSTGKINELMQSLRTEGNLDADTPAALVYRVSWPDERILRGTISNLAQKCEEAGVGRQALILVGKALGESDTSSLLYNAKFSHGYRNSLAREHFDGHCALYAFNQASLQRAIEIATGLGVACTIYSTRTAKNIPNTQNSKDFLDSLLNHSSQGSQDIHEHEIERKGGLTQINFVPIQKHNFDALLQAQWDNYDAHIFVGNTSFTISKIAPQLNKTASKKTNKKACPAVIACPESGAHIMSLTAGFRGNANRLSRRIARITGGQAVVTSSTEQYNFLNLAKLNLAQIKVSYTKYEQRKPALEKNCVTVVGLGSGSENQITPEVNEILRQCDIIAGYNKYVDFIRPRIANKPIIQNGMLGEVQRCTDTLATAAQGKHVCMVCSGDPGILAMAGLLFELRARNAEFKDVKIKVLPGITAANIAAASLGAPLQNGFSLISLSDLLVPTDEVRQNIKAVAKSALPVAIYNPAGKKRRSLLAEALATFKEERGTEILAAYVRHAGRPQEEKWIGKLGDFPEQEVDMSTLVLIGSERTVFSNDTLYEARGYADKYLEK